MTSKRLAILLVLFITALVAATTGWSQSAVPWDTRVFKIRYANLEDMAKVIGMFGGKMSTSEELRVITWTGPPELLPGIQQAVEQLDVPPEPVPNVEFAFYFLTASKGGATRDGVPAELQPVTGQLKEVFGFTAFSLLDTAFLRASHRAEANGMFRLPPSNNSATYTLDLRNVHVRAGEQRGNSISVSLDFRANVPGAANHAFLATDIEFREGQKAVVGKTNIDGSSDTFFLIVTGRVVTPEEGPVAEQK